MTLHDVSRACEVEELRTELDEDLDVPVITGSVQRSDTVP
jgi:hypothetical protein